MRRKTRSGRDFASWDGVHVTTAGDGFDLSALLQQAVHREEDHLNLDARGLGELAESDHECEPINEANANSPPLSQRMNAEAQSSEASPSHPPPTGPPSPFAIPPGLVGSARRDVRKKVQSKKNRFNARSQQNAQKFSHLKAREQVQKKYISDERAQATPTTVGDARVASTAYVGLDDRVREGRTYRLDELVGPDSEFKFELRRYCKGAPFPIISNDPEKYVIGIFADAPTDAAWPALAAEAAELLERTRTKLEGGDVEHRRGCFATLRCGVSHGSGQKMPGNLRNSQHNADLARKLNGAKPFQRLAKFTMSVLATWQPRLYDYYADRLGKLHAKYPLLRRNFQSSVFEATTYNLGPQTMCYRHIDFANLPFGLCAVTALGDFDYTKGGHLVLWDARLVIEFPPGTTFLIPSALVSHSNVEIQEHERRFSFTQYTAGGLFRWVENDFQRAVDFRASLSDEALEAHLLESRGRWKFGLSLLSRLSDLKGYRPSVHT